MRFYHWILLVLSVSSCTIPSAAPEEQPTLVIATDRMTASDSAFFNSFGKQHGAKVEIRQMSADSLLKIFRKNRYNTGIDVVLMHQMYDMRILTQNNLFETIEADELNQNLISNPQRTFVGIGIDPFICVTKKGALADVNVYDDLSRAPFINELSRKSKLHFFAPFEQRMTRAKTFKRIENIMNQSTTRNSSLADSSEVILCTYSQFSTKKHEDSLWNQYSQIHYPNSRTSGVFYDLLTFGIIDQTSHYALSIQLLNWINKKSTNKKFTQLRGYLPMNNHPQFSIYSRNPTKLMQYHTMIARMLGELK